jgi:proton glutamate symport protein
LKKLELHWQILIALVLSIIVGLTLPQYVDYISWLGTIFLRALKMIVIPLIFASIVTGVAGLGKADNLGRLSLKTMVYYIATSLIAIITGLFFVNLIKPGIGADISLARMIEGLEDKAGSFWDTFMNIIPENIFASMSAKSPEFPAIIFFAFIFGFFATRVSDRHREPVLDFFSGVLEIMMKITMFVIKFSPIGIFGIVTGVVVNNSGNLANLAGSLWWFMVTVVSGLLLHSVITLPLIVWFLAKSNPLKHFKAMALPLITAFSTATSSGTLPLTLKAVEENSGVSKNVSNFVLPLGATINMDGTALYQGVVALFLAQAYGIELTILQQFIVLFTALLASIGTAGIPMGSLVTMAIIISAVGLPIEGLAIILVVDRPLDHMRTAVNVWSDSCAAVIIAKSEGETLKV